MHWLTHWTQSDWFCSESDTGHHWSQKIFTELWRYWEGCRRTKVRVCRYVYSLDIVLHMSGAMTSFRMFCVIQGQYAPSTPCKGQPPYGLFRSDSCFHGRRLRKCIKAMEQASRHLHVKCEPATRNDWEGVLCPYLPSPVSQFHQCSWRWDFRSSKCFRSLKCFSVGASIPWKIKLSHDMSPHSPTTKDECAVKIYVQCGEHDAKPPCSSSHQPFHHPGVTHPDSPLKTSPTRHRHRRRSVLSYAPLWTTGMSGARRGRFSIPCFSPAFLVSENHETAQTSCPGCLPVIWVRRGYSG